MTAGLPGAGIGGIFYLGSALLMPFRQLHRSLTGRDSAGNGWGVALSQAGLALAIIGAMWLTGWLLALAALHGLVRPGAGSGAFVVHHHNIIGVAAVVMSFGSLALVLLAVQLLRLLIRPVAGPGAQDQDDVARRRRPRAATAAVALLAPALLTFATAGRLIGQVMVSAVAGRTAAAPSPPDSADVTRARALATAGRADAAIALYRAWVVRHPGDASAWRELGRQLQRAGRPGEAAAALEQALALSPDRPTASRLAALRVTLRPVVQPVVGGSRDSDLNQQITGGIAFDAAALARGRLGLQATRTRISDGGLTGSATSDALLATFHLRPLATLALDGFAGATRTAGAVPDTTSVVASAMGGMHGSGRGNAAGTTGSSLMVGSGDVSRFLPTARLRLRLRAPGGEPALEVRAFSTPVNASPALALAGAARDELAATLELPAGPLRLRGTGRIGDVRLDGDRNGRLGYDAALALPVTPALELSAQFHRFGYAHAVSSGYFAPRAAETIEGGAYLEVEPSDAFALSADVGGGVARLTRFGEAVGPWGPALRLWSMAAWTLMPGRTLQLEGEAYDTNAADAVGVVSATAWRYASLSVSVRVAL